MRTSMELRIAIELSKRAGTSIRMSEDYMLNKIIAQNKMALQADLNRRAIAAKHNMYWSSNLQKFVSIPE